MADVLSKIPRWGGGRSSRSPLSPCVSSSSRSCCGATTRSGAGCSSSCSSCSAWAPAAVRQHQVRLLRQRWPTSSASRPIRRSTATSAAPAVQPHPNGGVIKINVPDTHSHFGSFEANVGLPPQYFTRPPPALPRHAPDPREPRSSTDWLTSDAAATTGLAVAKAGKPSSCVMPTVLHNGSRATASASTPSRRATPRPTSSRTSRRRRQQLRTITSQAPRHRRLLHGGLLRAQPRAQASRHLLGGAGLLGGDAYRTPDTLPGGSRSCSGPTGSRRPTRTTQSTTRS